LLFLQRSPAHPDLHSFPTRRSSDLGASGWSAPYAAATRNTTGAVEPPALSDVPGRCGEPHPVATATSDAKTPRVTSRDLMGASRSEEHTSELQSRFDLVCRLLLEKK